MRNLVLGIIAVTLLQIGFAVYTSISQPAEAPLMAVKINRVNTGPQLNRAGALPEVKAPLVPATTGESSQKSAADKTAKTDVSRGTVRRHAIVRSASLSEPDTRS